MNAAGRCQICMDSAAKDRNPSQGQSHGHRSTQQNIRRHRERFQIDVRLIETIEKNEATCTGVDQFPGHVGKSAEDWTQFNVYWYSNKSFTGFAVVEVSAFYF